MSPAGERKIERKRDHPLNSQIGHDVEEWEVREGTKIMGSEREGGRYKGEEEGGDRALPDHSISKGSKPQTSPRHRKEVGAASTI